MKTILIISFSVLDRDPRVKRQIHFLSKHYNVIAAGIGGPGIGGVQFVSCEFSPPKGIEIIVNAGLLSLGRYESYYWRKEYINTYFRKLSGIHADLIIANDIESLPLALRLANGTKVIFDAHEYAPREFEDKRIWRLFFQGFNEYICKQYIPRANGMMTVCDGIANEYERNFGVKPVVVTNAPDYEDIEPHPTAPHKIRMIHHGAAIPSRKIENMIATMDYLDERFELDLMLVPVAGSMEYMGKIEKLARYNSNIHFLPPVPMQELIMFSSQYDVGLYLLESVNFNHRHALPNKFFEFIQARLALAIGPSPEMAQIVREHDCGVVSEDFTPEGLARSLMNLNKQKIDYYKQQSHRIARTMSSEQNEGKILKLVDQVLRQ